MNGAQEFYKLFAQARVDQKIRERNRQNYIREQLSDQLDIRLNRLVFHDLDGWVEVNGDSAKLTKPEWNLNNGDLVVIGNLGHEATTSADIYVVTGCEGLLVKNWLLVLRETIELPINES